MREGEAKGDRRGITYDKKATSIYGTKTIPKPAENKTNGIEKIIIHTNPDCPCAILDRQSGKTSITGKRRNPLKSYHQPEGGEWFGRKNHNGQEYQDTGGASRFFYQAKASRSERNMGLEGMEEKQVYSGGLEGASIPLKGSPLLPQSNNHPTVKPLKLMEYLVKLITPPKGICLDPFAGSGSTLIACKRLGFDFIGCEKEKEYCQIAEARLKAVRTQKTLF